MDSNTGLPQCTPPAPSTDLALAFGRCPTHWLIRQLADRWSLPVLSALQSSPKRFTELLKILSPISRRMLDRTLKKLMQIGLVTRTALAATPPQIHYQLTERGRTLASPLGRLVGWSQRNIATIAAFKAGRNHTAGKW